MATILIVDDQSIILDGMEAILSGMSDVEVVGRCANGSEAVELARELKPDLVLMDVNMPDMDGIEATRHVLKASPDSHVLMLSMYGHREFVLEVMAAGASGYLLKNAGKEELRMAMDQVLKGGQYLSPQLRQLLEQGDQYRDRGGELNYTPLSKREMEVVKLIVQELTNQEIADRLFISVDTVVTHRRNIMHKLDVRNTAGLVKYAVERGWEK
ncbi:MAG TPA: response regulator transcription factor [Flavobacteriales bacterium]|nr:response regulator transcription factor [Flavobacteriales bacterium]